MRGSGSSGTESSIQRITGVTRPISDFPSEDVGRIVNPLTVAVACFIEGAGAGPKETARLELTSDGTVAVYVGSAAVGQGLETVMAQIAADTLGIPLDRVRVFHGSTSYLEEGYGAFHSRSLARAASSCWTILSSRMSAVSSTR
jgi:hypothetical protein